MRVTGREPVPQLPGKTDRHAGANGAAAWENWEMDPLDRKDLHAPLPRTQHVRPGSASGHAQEADNADQSAFDSNTLEAGEPRRNDGQADYAGPPDRESSLDRPIPGKWPLGRTLRFAVVTSAILWALIFLAGWLIYGAL